MCTSHVASKGYLILVAVLRCSTTVDHTHCSCLPVRSLTHTCSRISPLLFVTLCYRSLTRSFAAMKRVRKLFQRALHGCVARPQTKLDVELEWDTAFTLSATARPAVQETSFAHIYNHHNVEAAQPSVPAVLARAVDAAAQASLATTTQAAPALSTAR